MIIGENYLRPVTRAKTLFNVGVSQPRFAFFDCLVLKEELGIARILVCGSLYDIAVEDLKDIKTEMEYDVYGRKPHWYE
jgi:hypothetical protein